MSPYAVALLEETERDYGVRVREEWLDDGHPPSPSGRSWVTDDGAPTIAVNRDHGREFDVIVHELYHFRLRTRGYPIVPWLMPSPMNTPAFEQLREQLYGPILYFVFDRQVRAAGIDPGKTLEERTRRLLRTGQLSSEFARMDRGAVALCYFKLRIELRDGAVLDEIIRTLGPGHATGIRFGQELAELVSRADPSSPRSAIGTLVTCLNRFYQDQWSFTERDWTSRRLGRHVQHVARIELAAVQRLGLKGWSWRG